MREFFAFMKILIFFLYHMCHMGTTTKPVYFYRLCSIYSLLARFSNSVLTSAACVHQIEHHSLLVIGRGGVTTADNLVAHIQQG